MCEQIIVTNSQLEASKTHVFCVEFDGEFYTSVYPEPLSELGCSFKGEGDAWYQVILDRSNQLHGWKWELDDPKKAGSCLWGRLGDIPVDEDDCLEEEFMHFAKGADQFEVVAVVRRLFRLICGYRPDAFKLIS